ncbi:MAG: NFACT family protein, partial [Pseudomonadota bacterium]
MTMARMPGCLSDLEIAQVVDELRPLLLGASVGKVYGSPGEIIVLELGERKLLVSAEPRACRLHLLFPPERSNRRNEQAKSPPAFAMLLRRHLSRQRLVDLEVSTPGERVVRFTFGRVRDQLIAELTGIQANIFLVSSDDRIVASLRPSRSASRQLAPGSVYRPPSPPPPLPPPAFTTSTSAKVESKPRPGWRGLRRFGDSPGVVERIASYYRTELERVAREELRERAAVGLGRSIQQLQRREHALEGDLAKSTRAPELRKYADLLLTHLAQVESPGLDSITLPDYFTDGLPMRIPLNPALNG